MKNRKGSRLEDGKAHVSDHESWSRRGFLRTIGLAGATTLTMSSLPVNGLFGFPLAPALAGGNTDRKLVLVRLKGGNDGLNTIVPMFAYQQYRAARPTLAHEENNLIQLNGDFSIPTAMNAMMPLWNEGKMRVINSVGYPNHNLSHFTSADIMASGNSNVNENGDGWLARYYTCENPDYLENIPSDPPAVKIGGPTSVVFNDANKIDISANFASADKLQGVAESGTLFNNILAPDNCYYGEQVLYVRTISNAASKYSAAIAEAYGKSSTGVEYTSSLGKQLELVARLIKGGLGTQLYLVTLDGFDTHVSQNGSGNHLGLLQDLSEAMAQFYEDLGADGKDGEVLAMTYSEFGRRVEENGVSGTDHGTAMPVMMFGPSLDGNGVHGKNPDLNDVDETGNLKFGTDFRSIYATILEEWLCVDGAKVDEVLGDSYERLEDVGLSCMSTGLFDDRPAWSEERHRMLTLGGGRFRMSFEISKGANVGLEILTISGRRVKSISPRYFHAGEQAIDFSLHDLGVERLPMVYLLSVEGKVRTGKFIGGK